MDEHNRTDYPGGPDTPVETPIAPPAPAEGDRTAQPVPEAPAAQEADPVREEASPRRPVDEAAPGRDGGDLPPRREPPQAGPGRQGKPPKRKKEKRGLGTAGVVALCLVCALIGGLVNPVYQHLTGSKGETSQSSTLTTADRALPAQEAPAAVSAGEKMDPAQIYAAYAGSAVGITVDIVTTNIWGQTVTGAAAGSGFVVTEDGYIVTNYHVIKQANAITVTFSDGTSYPADLIGGEEQNDVAVIKIDASGLTPVVIGKSGDLTVGEEVVAIGNPLGELTFSETHGIVSALNRVITTSASEKINMIQTDCAINSGSSGGPLFNDRGEVVGITTAKPSMYASGGGASVEGITFAIPMDDVYTIIKDLVENGYVTGKPYLGIVMSQSGVSQAAQAYGVPAGVPVLGVAKGLPADQAGIQANDIIVKFNGTETPSGQALSDALNQTKPGDEITVTVYRSGETLDLTLTVGEQTAEAQAATQKVSEELEKEQQAQQQQQQQEQPQQPQQGDGSQGGDPYWPFGSFGFGF